MNKEEQALITLELVLDKLYELARTVGISEERLQQLAENARKEAEGSNAQNKPARDI